MSDPIEIGKWVSQYKLPNDNFSVDNAIILKNSNKVINLIYFIELN